jgi:hypothetical protein
VDRGYYFISDSTYALKLFLLTPYNSAMYGTSKDKFYFLHSSSCISVECAFGKIDFVIGNPLEGVEVIQDKIACLT